LFLLFQYLSHFGQSGKFHAICAKKPLFNSADAGRDEYQSFETGKLSCITGKNHQDRLEIQKLIAVEKLVQTSIKVRTYFPFIVQDLYLARHVFCSDFIRKH
jgi:hypothetical protein